jgi:hypothetical protein
LTGVKVEAVNSAQSKTSNSGANEMSDAAPPRSLLPGLVLTLIGAALSAMVLAANTGGPPALEALAWRPARCCSGLARCCC